MAQTKQEWIQSLQTGDEVAIAKFGFRTSSYVISKVKKITPTGRITTENNLTFKPDGEEYGKKTDPWSIAAKLEMPTQEIRDEIEHQKLVAYLKSVRFENLSLETIRKIVELTSKESNLQEN